jgi:hypothetical protein
VAGSLHPARPAGVSSEVVGLVGGFCKALVTRACGDGWRHDAPGRSRLGGRVRASGRVFGICSLSALGRGFLSGVGCQQAWHPEIAG